MESTIWQFIPQTTSAKLNQVSMQPHKKTDYIAPRKLIVIGCILGILSWLLESFIHSHFFYARYPNFTQQLFFPDSHETWMRLAIISLFISFAIYAQRIIEALKRTETALAHAHTELTQIFETSADGMRVVDRDFTVLRVNKTFLALTGLSRQEAEGKKCHEIFSGHICHTDRCPLVRIIAGDERLEYDELKIRQDGQEIPCIVTATPFRNSTGELIGIVEDFKDISQRKESEEQLRNSHKQLRDLTSHMEQSRENDRKRMAREIHDELGQSLTVLNMDIHWLKKNLRHKAKNMSDKLDSMHQLVNNTVHTVQRLSSELRPGLLDDLGLSAAIEWQIGLVRDRLGIAIDLLSEPEDITLNDVCSITVFRIFQETLTNIARHSKASHVTVELKLLDKIITLTVQDNGKGISHNQLNDPKSLGLIGMKERTSSLGGTLNITGSPQSGTTVHLAIPMNNEARFD